MKTKMSFLLAMMVVIQFASFFSPPAVRSAEFPTKPVTLICPWTPGGATDVFFRVFAESASKYLGQPVVVENKPGGGGTVGPAAMAATAKPDGYTVAQISLPVFRYQHMMKVDYDALKDFAYVIGLTGYIFGVVVKADAPWKTFDGLIAFAKANPGKIMYGSPGTGTTQNITM
jgi:tripartite-type tricarboxylate transporter receptor subunit TctC